MSLEQHSSSFKTWARVLLPVMLLLAAPVAHAAETLTITFQTSAVGGRYNPRNVVAVFVKDGNNGFVKTLGRWARAQAGDLGAWVSASGGDSVAVMGATRSSHSGTLTVTWDMTNKAGQVVPNGNYTIGFDLADGQEASTGFPFVKDGAAKTQTVSGSVFSNVVMTYTGAAAGGGTTSAGGTTSGGATSGTSGTAGTTGTTGGTTGTDPTAGAGGSAPPTPPASTATCGDGVMNGSDQCDATDFGPKACKDFGFPGGPLRCTPSCTIDTSACIAPQGLSTLGDTSGGCAGAGPGGLWSIVAAVAFVTARRVRRL